MRFAVIGLTLLFYSVSVQAESLVLGELSAVSSLAQGFKLYNAVHGRAPTSLEQIESIFRRPLNETRKDLQPTTRYAFLEAPVPLQKPGERLVILSRSPFQDQYKMRGFFGPLLGSLPSARMRYGVVVSEDGEAGVRGFSDQQILELFSNAGISLPAPDPLGPRPYESANRFALYAWLGTALVVVFFGGRYVVSFLGRAIMAAWLIHTMPGVGRSGFLPCPAICKRLLGSMVPAK